MKIRCDIDRRAEGKGEKEKRSIMEGGGGGFTMYSASEFLVGVEGCVEGVGSALPTPSHNAEARRSHIRTAPIKELVGKKKQLK